LHPPVAVEQKDGVVADALDEDTEPLIALDERVGRRKVRVS
jgi:hypothetical protein